MPEPKPIPTISEQAKLLVLYLKDRTDATYGDMAKHLGESVKEGRGRGWLTTARRVLRREYGQVWLTIAKVGVKLGDSLEVIQSANTGVSKAHKAAWRGIQQISTLDFEKLDNAARLKLNTVASHLGAIHGITSAKATHHLTAAVAAQQEKLPLTKTLEAFRGGANGSA